MHKERIFSASSGRHRGTSSGNMEPCPRHLGVFSLPSAHIPIPPPLPCFAFTGAAAGGGRTERSLFLWNARTCAREGGACVVSEPRPVIGKAPPASPGPSFFLCPLSGVVFVFFSRLLRATPCHFFAAPCGTSGRGPAPPMRCVASRPARRSPCALSFPFARGPSRSRSLLALLRALPCFDPASLPPCPASPRVLASLRSSRRPRGLTG